MRKGASLEVHRDTALPGPIGVEEVEDESGRGPNLGRILQDLSRCRRPGSVTKLADLIPFFGGQTHVILSKTSVGGCGAHYS